MEIIIRGLEQADLADVAELRLTPEAQIGTLQLPYQSRDVIKKRFEERQPGDYSLVAVVKESQKVVGMLGLHTLRGRRAHAAQLGMSVHDDYQNQGVGSKLLAAALDLADNWLNLKRIELTVFTDNARAIHLYQKYGFIIEGTLRQYAFRAGEYVDTYSMARLRE
jgi:putative acetyltransferase